VSQDGLAVGILEELCVVVKVTNVAKDRYVVVLTSEHCKRLNVLTGGNFESLPECLREAIERGLFQLTGDLPEKAS